MSELPELRADLLPERPEPPRQLFDRDPHLRRGPRPGAHAGRPRPGAPHPRIRTRRRFLGGGPFRRPGTWWANSDHRPGDLWHRFRCRTGHHVFVGGHQMQFGSRFEFVERTLPLVRRPAFPGYVAAAVAGHLLPNGDA